MHAPKNLLLLLSWLLGCQFLFAQTPVTLTKREVYDYEVGDEFHYYRAHTTFNPYEGISYFIKRVLAKTVDSLSITYTLELNIITNGCYSQKDTIQETHTDLDSLMDIAHLKGDFVHKYNFLQHSPYGLMCINVDIKNGGFIAQYNDDTTYNARTLIQYYYDDPMPLDEPHAKWAKGLGDVYVSEGGGDCSINVNLLYFKKGTEEWGTSVVPHFVPLSLLSRREVLDYDIGDVFQSHLHSFTSGYIGSTDYHVYRHKKVIDKIWNSSESVTYKFRMIDSFPSTESVVTYIASETYDDLSSPCIGQCNAERVTLWEDCTNSGIQAIIKKSPYYFNRYRTVCIKGCGISYESSARSSSPYSYTKNVDTLVYFSKAAVGAVCGSKVIADMPISLQESDLWAHYTEHSHTLSIRFAPDDANAQMVLADIAGRIIYTDAIPDTGNFYDIPNLQLERGAYVLFLNKPNAPSRAFKLLVAASF